MGSSAPQGCVCGICFILPRREVQELFSGLNLSSHSRHPEVLTRERGSQSGTSKPDKGLKLGSDVITPITRGNCFRLGREGHLIAQVHIPARRTVSSSKFPAPGISSANWARVSAKLFLNISHTFSSKVKLIHQKSARDPLPSPRLGKHCCRLRRLKPYERHSFAREGGLQVLLEPEVAGQMLPLPQ